MLAVPSNPLFGSVLFTHHLATAVVLAANDCHALSDTSTGAIFFVAHCVTSREYSLVLILHHQNHTWLLLHHHSGLLLHHSWLLLHHSRLHHAWLLLPLHHHGWRLLHHHWLLAVGSLAHGYLLLLLLVHLLLIHHLLLLLVHRLHWLHLLHLHLGLLTHRGHHHWLADGSAIFLIDYLRFLCHD